jgi:hypothetical protein
MTMSRQRRDLKPLPPTPKRHSPWPLENKWAFPPEQLVALVDVLFKGVTEREWRLLNLLYAPDARHQFWMRKAREEFTMTVPQVKAMRERLEQRLIRQLIEAYALAKEELDGKAVTPLSRDPSVRIMVE